MVKLKTKVELPVGYGPGTDPSVTGEPAGEL